MLTIRLLGGKFCIGSEAPGKVPVLLDGLQFSSDAAARLRELFCPAPTAEQAERAEVAALEAEFDKAKDEVLGLNWDFINSRGGDRKAGPRYTVFTPGRIEHFPGDTRADAARAAAEYVRALKPAEKPVESMTARECADEMHYRGWIWVEYGGRWRGYIRDEHAIQTDGIRDSSNRAALTRARELDAEAGKQEGGQ